MYDSCDRCGIEYRADRLVRARCPDCLGYRTCFTCGLEWATRYQEIAQCPGCAQWTCVDCAADDIGTCGVCAICEEDEP